jgi:biotin carboxylase
MIGKLIIHGATRDDALARAARALRDFECEGVTTTLDFHKILLDDAQFQSGDFHTRWVETDFLPRMR